MRPGVICAGRLYTDLVFTGLGELPRLGAETFASGLAVHPGGGAFITAAHLSALGRPAALLSYLPPPPFDAAIAAGLAEADIALDMSQRARPGIDAQVTVAMAHQSDRAFLTRRCGPAVPDLPQVLTGYKHLHIGELTTLLEAPELVPAARTAGMTISADCGSDDALERGGLTPLLSQIDVLLPNADEAEALIQSGHRLPFAPLTVIKQGAMGAEAVTASHRLSDPAEPAGVVDTTGAGDAFNAGFLNAWLDNRPLSNCLRDGNLQGALAVSAPGGASMLHQPAKSAAAAR
ncbi:MAG: PfkB family carbohydrate kinase [Pseudomonadota bacterium]